MRHLLVLVLVICGSYVSGCVSHKAKPPCVPSDGDVAYGQDGTLRKDGLFVNWQCYDRMLADAQACYDAAK